MALPLRSGRHSLRKPSSPSSSPFFHGSTIPPVLGITYRPAFPLCPSLLAAFFFRAAAGVGGTAPTRPPPGGFSEVCLGEARQFGEIPTAWLSRRQPQVSSVIAISPAPSPARPVPPAPP